MDIERYLLVNKKNIDKALDRYLPSIKVKPQLLHKAMRYAVFSGGKRIRPILTIMAFEACGGDAATIMPAACAIELIHTYTLIHDDLPCMDNDEYRRGKLTCHKRFGEDIALLAGDALLTMAFYLFAEAGDIDVIKDVSKAIGSRGTVAGQAADISITYRRPPITRYEIDYIHAKKTAALFETAVRLAGIFKKAGWKKIDALGEFGRAFGIAFQLVDDLMDKDGYVKLYNEDYVRNRAGCLTEKAKQSLEIFGSKAGLLNEIADIILSRKC